MVPICKQISATAGAEIERVWTMQGFGILGDQLK
jgi:hypothetical protein